MLPDFEMIQHQFMGGHDITIIPVSDVHLGSPECMEQEFIQFVQKVKNTPNVYLILGGDLIDNGTRSSVSEIFKATMSPSQQKKAMAKILSDVSDRILCFVPGNHERRSGKDADDDPVYDIAAKLDLEHLYRENIAFLKIQLGLKTGASGHMSHGFDRPTYVITVLHGAGGGIYTGAAVNRNERFGYVIDGMDALIVGHTHKPFATQPGKIKIDPFNNKVSIKPFKVISSTSWLEYGGYAARQMLLPATHCLHTLTLKGRKKEIIVTM
ncbi:MAG: metallophosphoesterase [Bacteroidales bacterium]|nr:metallophosphoesterase [Bacteroidales bacterium]